MRSFRPSATARIGRTRRRSLLLGLRQALEPAVALMSRLRYAQKFVLISFLFAIPIGLMMYLWLAELNGRLHFTKVEEGGLEYVVALRHLLEPLDRSRALRLLAEHGDA